MEPNALTLTNLRLSTTCSTKFPRDQNQTNTPKSYAQIPKRSPGPVSKGLQKDSKKDLSRILRTDAAIKGIARKANSRKYTQLWPKAVLEALDEAIRENQWQTALKVCGFCFSFQIVVFNLFFSLPSGHMVWSNPYDTTKWRSITFIVTSVCKLFVVSLWFS